MALQDYQEEEQPFQLAQLTPSRVAREEQARQQYFMNHDAAIAQEQERRKKLADFHASPEGQAFLAKEQEAKQLQQAFQRNPKLQEQFLLERAKASLKPQSGVMTGSGYMSKDEAMRTKALPPSLAGGGQLNPQTLDFVAKQYLAGDRQAIQGFARNSTARIALQNAIVDEAGRRGMTPAATAAQIADFAGVMAGSRTVGQRAANISLAATEAQEMLGIVKETSDKFGRTNFVPWNMALKTFESGTGEPEIAEFGAAVNALVNVYARAINPTGVPTVSDKEHARAVLNTVQSPAQVDAVLGIIRRELEIAKKAPRQVQEATRANVTGQPAAPPTAPTATAPTQGGVWKVIK